MRELRPLAVLAVACGVSLLRPTPARACYNEVIRELSPVEEIATAERDLSHGKLADATWRVRVRYPSIRSLGPDAPPLALRAQRIYALALVRANGMLDSREGWARWGNLEWALETLRELDGKRPNEPRSQADLAEARVKLPRTRASGVAVLESLDRRDLLGSPFSYIALASARREVGDDGGVRAALRRCVAMSVDRARCQVEVW
ncbi:MAG: hypothetical protein KC657_28895 [Myxococcales bacterium]|nr:hypothetical protein [Myxococcales bacterium]